MSFLFFTALVSLSPLDLIFVNLVILLFVTTPLFCCWNRISKAKIAMSIVQWPHAPKIQKSKAKIFYLPKRIGNVIHHFAQILTSNKLSLALYPKYIKLHSSSMNFAFMYQKSIDDRVVCRRFILCYILLSLSLSISSVPNNSNQTELNSIEIH